MTDVKLISYVREFRDGLLAGRGSWLACMMVCAPLATLLDACDIETEMVVSVVENDAGDGCNHVFLRLDAVPPVGKMIRRDDLCEAIGWSPTSSNIRDRLGKLRRLGLIVPRQDGHVARAEWLR